MVRCQVCGARVGYVFEHVDVSCRPIGDVPRDGTTIVGLYADDVRDVIRWSSEPRSHPAGGPDFGPGWINAENIPNEEPLAWAEKDSIDA